MEPKGERLGATEVLKLLWPLNDMFRARFTDIRCLPYAAAFEPEADAAIESWAYGENPNAWSDISPGAWRVLLERHQQALMVAGLGEITGDFMIEIPAGLSQDRKRAALILIWLYRMKLPFPIVDRSRDELPPAARPEAGKPN